MGIEESPRRKTARQRRYRKDRKAGAITQDQFIEREPKGNVTPEYRAWLEARRAKDQGKG